LDVVRDRFSDASRSEIRNDNRVPSLCSVTPSNVKYCTALSVQTPRKQDRGLEKTDPEDRTADVFVDARRRRCKSTCSFVRPFMCCSGDLSVSYLNTRVRFYWDEVTYSVFLTYSMITNVAGNHLVAIHSLHALTAINRTISE